MNKLQKINKIQVTKLKTSTKLVYNCLVLHCDIEFTCFPSHRTMAKETNLSISTVKRGIKELEKQEYIKIKNRYLQNKNGMQTSNLYIVI